MELPHWLMVAGALLIAVGFLGLALTRNKEVEVDSHPEPPAPRQKVAASAAATLFFKPQDNE